MSQLIAAQIDAMNRVTRVIVGSASWASRRLGGVWVSPPEAAPGWVYDPATNRCTPPQET